MFVKKFLKPLLTGSLAAMPIALTGAVILWLVKFIHDLLGPHSTFGKLLGSIGLQFFSSEYVAYFVGLAIGVALLYFLGVLVELGLKNRMHAIVDDAVNRLPIVRTIYQTSRQMVGMLDKDERTDLKAMSPVTCHFGGEGGASVLGLLSNPDPVEMNGVKYNAVLIPSAPVPFGGFIIYVPVEWVKPTEFGFDGLLNIYMSMGATSNNHMGPDPKS